MSVVIPSDYISFKDWIQTLLIDFNTKDDFFDFAEEKNWREVCDAIATNPTFTAGGCPTTSAFSNWRDWGKMAINTF